ncbi:hypothetical protein GQ53DRAFT_421029 [Thozetella sp. PMI_491]|nr:hypothetical protein GQ53DRAFT_421029 [Thozetella sp. PMI_491]
MMISLILAGLLVSLALAPAAHARPRHASSRSNPPYHADAGVLQFVNPKIGTLGYDPNDNGGMIPSVSPPFGMTRWTPQTRENFISQVPYSDRDPRIHGFQATHQPAIWMGELGQVILAPGVGPVRPRFEDRGLAFCKADERSTAYVYEVMLDAAPTGATDWGLTETAAGSGPVPGGAGGVPNDVRKGANGRTRRGEGGLDLPLQQVIRNRGNQSTCAPAQGECSYARGIQVAMSASAHVGHLRLDYVENGGAGGDMQEPYVFIQATRANWTGHVAIDPARREISGSNPQLQDYLLGPDRPDSFRGYFVSRFSEPFQTFGVSHGNATQDGATSGEGEDLGAYATFHSDTARVEVRTGVSFISVEQARRNLDVEIPDGQVFEATVEATKSAWLEKLGRVTVEGGNETDADHDPRTIFYTGLFHSLQYPSDFSEPRTEREGGLRRFYSGYTDSVHEASDSYYQSWSIWDTYRAEHSLLALLAPERVSSMMRSLLRIFEWSGRLPMWANLKETNIMVGTNADVVLANALARGFRDFDVQTAWAAVRKDAYVPPDQDTKLLYYDREPGTPYEARAGLTSYLTRGWVANDGWSESASRTLDYAFEDYAAAVVATHAGDLATAEELFNRSGNYRTLWNADTQFMQARNANGSFADRAWGWTEGDDWVYTFDVMHDVDGLAALFTGGRAGMKAKLDAHFDGGHNLHSNEPAHHVPYLYAAIGDPDSAAERVRAIAWADYNATSAGLSGNEDLGQMSAWYVFSALGFYPVNPAGDSYVVGSPFFDTVTLRLPAGAATGGRADADGGAERTLVIRAPGAAHKPYVRGVIVDGRRIEGSELKHADIVGAETIEFEMSDTRASP